MIKILIEYTEQPCTSLITEMLLSKFVHGDVTCFKQFFQNIIFRKYSYWTLKREFIFPFTFSWIEIRWYALSSKTKSFIRRVTNYLLYYSKNLYVVYYCKCCNLIGYATRYLFVNRYRVAVSETTRPSFSEHSYLISCILSLIYSLFIYLFLNFRF